MGTRLTPHPILDLLPSLPERHQAALRWFAESAGTEQPWPRPLPDGTLLATRAKGIYKPAWSKFALSIRETLSSPYPDQAPEQRPDGTWSYRYYQENLSLDERDSMYTNVSLIACHRAIVPMGVMIQTQGKPNVRYRVLGLALITGWDAGHFVLEGLRGEFASDRGRQFQRIAGGDSPTRRADILATTFDPRTVVDERKRTLSLITQRRGQPSFRRELLRIYSNRCVVTDCEAIEVLEAAHIVPYRGLATNHESNGLLFRSDLHTLFDLGLIAVDTDHSRIVVSQVLRKTSYKSFEHAPLRPPSDAELQPSREALRMHREWAGI